MKRLLSLSLLALPLLLVSCDNEIPNEPDSVEDGALFFGKTVIPARNVQIILRCAHGEAGSITYQLSDDASPLHSGGVYCGEKAMVTADRPPTKISVHFYLTASVCGDFISQSDLPARIKCPASKKAYGTVDVRYQ